MGSPAPLSDISISNDSTDLNTMKNMYIFALAQKDLTISQHWTESTITGTESTITGTESTITGTDNRKYNNRNR
jgi:hypothetical protein